MEFDLQYGWVERGTRGVHGGAVVQDVAREVAWLEYLADDVDFYSWHVPGREVQVEEIVAQRLEEADTDRNMARGFMSNARAGARTYSRAAVELRLSTMTPYIATLRASEAHIERQSQRPPDPQRAMLTTPRRTPRQGASHANH